MSIEGTPEQSPFKNHITVVDKIKRAPWIDISLIVGVVALIAIAGLAHFGMIHHIGALSQTSIQYTTVGGAGGVLFFVIAQRIMRCIARARQPSPLELLKPMEMSYKHLEYSVQGIFPPFLKTDINTAIEKINSSTNNSLQNEIDTVFRSSSGSITIKKGDQILVKAIYKKGRN